MTGSEEFYEDSRSERTLHPMRPVENSRRKTRCWIEIDDFLRSLQWSLSPAGIQRVQMEILPRLLEANRAEVRFFRMGRSVDAHVAVSGEEVLKAIAAFRALQTNAVLGVPQIRLRQALRVLFVLIKRAGRLMAKPNHPMDADRPLFRRSDVVVSLGASWEHPFYSATMYELKKAYRVKFLLLVHDLLPLTHPQFVSPEHIPNFSSWLDGVGTVWDAVITPSNATAQSLRTYLDARHIPKPKIEPVQFGGGFHAQDQARNTRLKLSGPYVASVSTIEIRKNHVLLVRVWDKLIKELGSDKVPNLVLVGKLGWEIDELLAEVEKTQNLNGKLKILSSVSDAQLSTIYENCLFTVFPSFCEGWGLPVSESLAHGKFCIASNATSIPEIGGQLVEYFDPQDFEAAYARIKHAITNAGHLKMREADIKSRFSNPTWDGTVDQILEIVDHVALSK